MRTILFLVCILLSVKSLTSTQCVNTPDVIGGCGCCGLLSAKTACVTFETIDGLASSWHACVPDYLKDSFTLDLCRPGVDMGTNHTRICRTKKYGVFRLFPQCATKQQCLLKTFAKDYEAACKAEFAVIGSGEEPQERYSYDPEQRKCVSFTYLGSKGSANNFRHLEICQKNCEK